MKIQSVFDHHQEIPEVYTCLGRNVNPPLEFVDIPAQTQSLVLLFEDVDATPEPWTHWLLFNIPPSVSYVDANQIPAGATEGLANNHTFGYEGPCPKYFQGTHRYWFRLYALDTVINLPAASERADITLAMRDHILAKAELLGLCTREPSKPFNAQ